MTLTSRALKSVGNLPPTPNTKVKHLTSELEKQKNENDDLKSSISDLTKALAKLEMVNDKVSASDNHFNPVNVNKKIMNKKDPNAPRPCTSAYKYYCDGIKGKTDTDLTVTDLRQAWKDCPKEVRKAYLDMAAADKKRYELENKEYQESIKHIQIEETALLDYYEKQKQDMAMEFYEAHVKAQEILNKKKKTKKDPEAPKRPLSSYMIFTQEKRETVLKQNPGASVTEISKILGKEWSKLEKGKGGKKGTKKYDELAAKAKARYDLDKEVYDALKAEEDVKVEEVRQMKLVKDKEEAMKLLTERQDKFSLTEPKSKEEKSVEKSVVKVKKQGPKKPSSAYNCYVSQNAALIKASLGENATTQEAMVELGSRWRTLNDDDKIPYVEMALKDKKRYEVELEAAKSKATQA